MVKPASNLKQISLTSNRKRLYPVITIVFYFVLSKKFFILNHLSCYCIELLYSTVFIYLIVFVCSRLFLEKKDRKFVLCVLSSAHSPATTHVQRMRVNPLPGKGTQGSVTIGRNSKSLHHISKVKLF